MVFKLGYDSNVKRLNSATVAALTLVAGAWICLAFAPVANAQINGVPSSVTSTNFGGHPNSTPGVPASITSVGPRGIQPRNLFPNQPGCCINPLFPVNPNPPNNRHHHHQSGQFFPGGGAVYIPYAYPVVGEPDPGDAVADQQENRPEDDYRGGPTIFDRRGPGEPARSYADAYPPPHRLRQEAEEPPAPPPAETPVADQPQTLLVFKDGHQLEVQNYAVIGDTLYDLTPGRHHKIAIDELDLTSTAKQNDERGIDFRLPPKPETKK
jgi:hypothetical protein